MQRFRPRTHESATTSTADLLAVSEVIDDAMQPGNFFAAPRLHLSWIAARSETVAWEIFRGHLLDAAQTRLSKTFLSWQAIQDEASEPTISVKLDVHGRLIHVTRGMLSYVWEGYDAGGGVIESREVTKWARELVGTIVLADYADLDSVHDELICLLWQAVVGTSRLPLTSLEAPLPAFVFGELHYLYVKGAGETPGTSWEDWLRRGMQTVCAWRETVKLAEFALRRIEGTAVEIRRLVDLVGAADSATPLLRALFNDVSLSPYTRFTDNALALGIHSGGIDFLEHLLRQLGRHLTAYDLVMFHHRGANYPDALLLDAAFKQLVTVLAKTPNDRDGDDARSRLVRRALRQTCLLRRQYEGHFVPDAPTSPGENARVMPASHPRVPEVQLTQMHRRQRRLFAEQSLADWSPEDVRAAIAKSIQDLEQLDERVEMGLGLFIDRPLGYAREVGEPDLTPLLAYEAFSPSLARRRWQELRKLCTEIAIPCEPSLDDLFASGPWPSGLPQAELADCPRPVAALADVRKVADDFVILRTLPGSLGVLMSLFDWQPLLERYRLRFIAERSWCWCAEVRDERGAAVLALGDVPGRRRVEMRVDVSGGYARRAGVEWPRAGLHVIRVWEDTDDPAVLRQHDLGETSSVRVAPRGR
jgi:hypothetical protein